MTLDRAAARARCEAATPGPWRDITAEWNTAQAAYYRLRRRHYHGPLRGCRKRSAKDAHFLIVQDCHHGRPLDFSGWAAGPAFDWYDLTKIVSLAADMWQAKWHGSGPVENTAELVGSKWGDADRAFIAHARLDLPLALDALDAADRRAAELEAALREMARGCRACSGTGVVRVPDFANAGMTEFGPLPGGKTVGCSDCRPARDVLGLPTGEKP